ncbi:MAG: helix-turn-helix transcriptional regulator [Vicinamibacterales bacterium]
MKPHLFHILLALSKGQLHGYAVQRAVLAQTEGDVRLWPAMLYRSLAHLEADGLIAAAPPPAEETDDERRQYYAITAAGRRRLREEGDRLARWGAAARRSARQGPS